jgi:hypothetical protein
LADFLRAHDHTATGSNSSRSSPSLQEAIKVADHVYELAATP